MEQNNQAPPGALSDPMEQEFARREANLNRQLAELDTQRAAYDSAVGRGVGLDEQVYEAEFGRQERNLRMELERLEQERMGYRRTRAADVQVDVQAYTQERMAAVEQQQQAQAAQQQELKRQTEARDAYKAAQQAAYERWLQGQAAAGNL